MIFSGSDRIKDNYNLIQNVVLTANHDGNTFGLILEEGDYSIIKLKSGKFTDYSMLNLNNWIDDYNYKTSDNYSIACRFTDKIRYMNIFKFIMQSNPTLTVNFDISDELGNAMLIVNFDAFKSYFTSGKNGVFIFETASEWSPRIRASTEWLI